MISKYSSRQIEAAQYASPVARDLEGLSHELMGMACGLGAEQWARLRLIIMQLRSIAGQVDGLVIPDQDQVGA